ncbi:MAG: UDP-N-acetylenolpyruvoylglucosamine reductase [Bacteroidetes bacterium]|nr:MAG: UDP-N-acetylenolpyruvoylglucosamine reductase [Bacteroidota bacterium]
MIDLTSYTTFGLPARTKELVKIQSVEELTSLHERLRSEQPPYYILGHGANVIFRGDFPGLVIRFAGEYLSIEDHGDHTILVASAAYDWCDFVETACYQGWGLECLAGIPGTVGAAPIQNIGAYGAEVKDTLRCVRSYDLLEGTFHERGPEELEFGYRDSLFKHTLRQRELIYEVEFRVEHSCLDRGRFLRLGYQENELHGLSPLRIYDRVLKIRGEKLPDVEQIGSAGSFFKNPVVPTELAEGLLEMYPSMPTYPAEDGHVKLSAAWLLDTDGWKGHRKGDAGVWHLQPLVLINHGKASVEEVLALSEAIQTSVRQHFGIELEREVNLVG